MLGVNDVVGLGKTAGDRLSETEKSIQKFGPKERVVNEVVPDAVDIRVDHQRVDETQNEHEPERRVRVEEEQGEEKREMEKTRRGGDRVPATEGEDFRVGRDAFDLNRIRGHENRNGKPSKRFA